MSKTIVRTRGDVKGKNQHQRLDNAYQDWKSGKENSLEKLAGRYHIHVPDISRYITKQFEIAKSQKENK